MAFRTFGGDRGGFGGRKDFGSKPRFGGGDRGGFSRGGNRDFGSRPPVQMHEAVCAQCQKNCEVPFRPNGEKPVYCNDCFGGTKSDGPARKPEMRDRERSSYAPARTEASPSMAKVEQELKRIQDKLDMLISRMEVSKPEKASQAEEVHEVVSKVVAKNAPVEKAAKSSTKKSTKKSK